MEREIIQRNSKQKKIKEKPKLIGVSYGNERLIDCIRDIIIDKLKLNS